MTLDPIVHVSSVFLRNVIKKLDRFSSEEPSGDASQLWSHVSSYVSKDFASYFLFGNILRYYYLLSNIYYIESSLGREVSFFGGKKS